MAGSSRAAAGMMRPFAGVQGESVVSAAVLISIFAALNGSLLSGSRVPFARARSGYFFRAAGPIHPAFSHPPSELPGMEPGPAPACSEATMMNSTEWPSSRTRFYTPGRLPRIGHRIRASGQGTLLPGTCRYLFCLFWLQ